MNDTELLARIALSHVRRVLAVGHSIFTVTKRHVPKWIAGVLTVCLFIPGPLDEVLVLLVIAVMVAFKPVMRRDLASGIKSAWALDLEQQSEDVGTERRRVIRCLSCSTEHELFPATLDIEQNV